MKTTDHILLRTIAHETETRGVSTLSTRQLAEATGLARHTVGRSLSRLAADRRIRKVQEASGGAPAHWKAHSRQSSVPVPLARNVPRHNRDGGVPDVFRRRDLRSPGALYYELPERGFFTARDLLQQTSLTTQVKTLEHWLMVLSSLKWPLVDAVLPDDGKGELLWVKIERDEFQMAENAAQVNHAAAGAGRPTLKTREAAQLDHQLERASFGRMFPKAVR